MAETVEEKAARLEREIQDKERQLSGLANERNTYRQKAEAWERNVGSHLGDMLRLDPQTGLPVGIERETRQPVTYTTGGHPLQAVANYTEGFNPQQVDAYYAQLMKQQGFLTQDQAQQWADNAASRAYNAARGDFMVMRNYDRLTGQDRYKDLANPDSELSKRTARILQERKLGEPLEGAKTFDGWRYGTLESLQMGADLARLELHEEAQRTQQAGQAGQAAGMASGGGVGGLSSVTEDKWMEAADKGDVGAMRDMIGSHIASVTGTTT